MMLSPKICCTICVAYWLTVLLLFMKNQKKNFFFGAASLLVAHAKVAQWPNFTSDLLLLCCLALLLFRSLSPFLYLYFFFYCAIICEHGFTTLSISKRFGCCCCCYLFYLHPGQIRLRQYNK